MPQTNRTEAAIRRECDALAALLIRKNRAYGDSALRPVRVFSHAGAMAQLDVRIDDKLSRIVRGKAAGEDVERDLAGYLILRRILRGRIEAARRKRAARGKG